MAFCKDRQKNDSYFLRLIDMEVCTTGIANDMKMMIMAILMDVKYRLIEASFGSKSYTLDFTTRETVHFCIPLKPMYVDDTTNQTF